jgi:putative hydrolase
LAKVEDYRMVYDHHTHTVYSHGKGTIEENVRVAATKGLSSIAITDHGPGHLTYGFDMAKVGEIRQEITRLQPLYPDVKILLGIEANTVRISPYLDLTEEDKKQFDIILAGYHYGIRQAGCVANWTYSHTGFFGGDSTLKVKNTAMILNALYENHIDVLTHPGDKGPFDIEDIAKACADTGTLMEINMKHAHLTQEEIAVAARYDVKFIIGSDAHVPEAVGAYQASLARAFAAGLEPERIVNIEKR